MKASAGRYSKPAASLIKHVRETLTRGLVEYINGPEAPTSGDELTFFITREMMREFAPRLILVNFWDMDVAHWGSYSLYLQAITRTDRLTGMLWDEVQSNPTYKDQDDDARAARTRSRWRHQHGEWISESSQRRSIVPEHVAAGAGRGG